MIVLQGTCNGLSAGQSAIPCDFRELCHTAFCTAQSACGAVQAVVIPFSGCGALCRSGCAGGEEAHLLALALAGRPVVPDRQRRGWGRPRPLPLGLPLAPPPARSVTRQVRAATECTPPVERYTSTVCRCPLALGNAWFGGGGGVGGGTPPGIGLIHPVDSSLGRLHLRQRRLGQLGGGGVARDWGAAERNQSARCDCWALWRCLFALHPHRPRPMPSSHD